MSKFFFVNLYIASHRIWQVAGRSIRFWFWWFESWLLWHM